MFPSGGLQPERHPLRDTQRGAVATCGRNSVYRMHAGTVVETRGRSATRGRCIKGLSQRTCTGRKLVLHLQRNPGRPVHCLLALWIGAPPASQVNIINSNNNSFNIKLSQRNYYHKIPEIWNIRPGFFLPPDHDTLTGSLRHPQHHQHQ